MNSPALKAAATWVVRRIAALRVTFEGAKCNPFQRSFRVAGPIQNFGDGRNEVGVENPEYFADTWSILVRSHLASTHETVGYRITMAAMENIPFRDKPEAAFSSPGTQVTGIQPNITIDNSQLKALEMRGNFENERQNGEMSVGREHLASARNEWTGAFDEEGCDDAVRSMVRDIYCVVPPGS
jgi:hypothetical protein